MSTLRHSLQLALAVVAILLAAAGQYVHTYYHLDLLALALFVIALVLWIVVIVSTRADIETPSTESSLPSGSRRRISIPLVLSAVALAVFTFIFSSGNQFTLDNIIAWLGSVGAILYTFWEPGSVDWRTRFREYLATVPVALMRAALLVAILLIGIVFYFYNLKDTSPINSPLNDKANAVNQIVRSDTAPIFFDSIPGGEPLEIYLAAGVAKVFDMTADALMLKQVSAIIGWLLIPLAFLLAREMFDADVGLIAAFFIAISKWNMTIARMGFQFVFAPVFVALVMLFLVRAFKYQRRNDFLLAGFFIGAGVYGYSAFRIAPFLVLALTVLWLLRLLFQSRRAQIGQNVADSVLMFVVALVVAMPLLRYATEQPKQIATPIVYLVGNDTTSVTNPIQTFALNLVGAATMFNWTSDANPLNAVPHDPTLDYITGALFLLGVAFALDRTLRYREGVFAFLFIGLATLVLPSALNVAHPAENPSIVRAAGAIPFVFIIAALPVARVLQFVKTRQTMTRRIVVIVILLLLLIVSMRANFLRYYRDYASSVRQESRNTAIFDLQLPIFKS